MPASVEMPGRGLLPQVSQVHQDWLVEEALAIGVHGDNLTVPVVRPRAPANRNTRALEQRTGQQARHEDLRARDREPAPACCETKPRERAETEARQKTGRHSHRPRVAADGNQVSY